jgi:hypothetical protein
MPWPKSIAVSRDSYRKHFLENVTNFKNKGNYLIKVDELLVTEPKIFLPFWLVILSLFITRVVCLTFLSLPLM